MSSLCLLSLYGLDVAVALPPCHDADAGHFLWYKTGNDGDKAFHKGSTCWRVEDGISPQVKQYDLQGCNDVKLTRI